jgi:MerR family transcriptional regulator, thiopeptide resistance regulator
MDGTQSTARRWTTAEVVRLSGVTSRTLRHYDAIGLLPPAGTAPGGQRVYGHDELLRLQQVLVLRELGVGLPEIARLLDAERQAGPDARTALLREHHRRLLRERDRFDRLARTVATTLESLEGGSTMSAADLYDGFDHRQHEPEARERWGAAVVDRSTARWEAMSAEQRADHQAEASAVSTGLAALMADGIPVTDPAVRALVVRHHAWVSLFWTPDAEAYAALGATYVDDPRFAATYDAVAPGLAVYLRDAVAAHAGSVARG